MDLPRREPLPIPLSKGEETKGDRTKDAGGSRWEWTSRIGQERCKPGDHRTSTKSKEKNEHESDMAGTVERSCTMLVHFDKAASQNEVKEALENGDDKTKTEAMKKVVLMLLNGEQMQALFIPIVRYVLPSEDHNVQKLLLLYLVRETASEDPKKTPTTRRRWNTIQCAKGKRKKRREKAVLRHFRKDRYVVPDAGNQRMRRAIRRRRGKLTAKTQRCA